MRHDLSRPFCSGLTSVHPSCLLARDRPPNVWILIAKTATVLILQKTLTLLTSQDRYSALRPLTMQRFLGEASVSSLVNRPCHGCVWLCLVREIAGYGALIILRSAALLCCFAYLPLRKIFVSCLFRSSFFPCQKANPRFLALVI